MEMRNLFGNPKWVDVLEELGILRRHYVSDFTYQYELKLDGEVPDEIVELIDPVLDKIREKWQEPN